LTAKDIDRLKNDVCKEAVQRATLVTLTAVSDIMGADDDTLCKVMETTSRYCEYLDDHLVRIEDVRQALIKGTGLDIKPF
jgi:hypothetical protein